jgi:hypothetical protein
VVVSYANPTKARTKPDWLITDQWLVLNVHQPDIVRLILFGLLPPLTWVLAAMIENTMY